MKPEMILQKKAEKTTNKMRIPKFIVKKWGFEFRMEIYKDKIILIPLKEGE